MAKSDIKKLQAKCRLDFKTYVQFRDPTYTMERMHKHICSLLQKVADGEILTLILTAPPRHGKSRLTAWDFPAWYLGRDPSKEVAVVGYNKDLPKEALHKCREQMRDDRYKFVFPNFRVVRGRDAADEFKTEGLNTHGCYRAIGIDSGFTGKGADLIVFDDPVKNTKDANSKTIRDKVFDFFVDVATTRLTAGGKGAMVIIMTRWHEDDIVGRLTNEDVQDRLRDAGMDMDKFVYCNLAAEALDNDPLGREPGEYLSDGRITPMEYKRIKALSPRSYQCLYMGDPVAEDGNLLDINKLKVISEKQLAEDPLKKHLLTKHRTLSVDFAFAEEGVGDDSAVCTGTYVAASKNNPGELYIFDIDSDKISYPELKARLQGKVVDPLNVELVVESNGPQKGLLQDLSNSFRNLPIIVKGINPKGDKVSRFLPVVSLADVGNIYLVKKGNQKLDAWIEKFRAQAKAFPNGKHDDMVDTVSMLHEACLGDKMESWKVSAKVR